MVGERGTAPRSSDARDAIVRSAWGEAMSRDASQMLAGVSLRQVAAAAGVSPGTVKYHFPTAADLGRAMGERLMADMSFVPVDEVADAFRELAGDGLAVAVRTAAQVNWDTSVVPEEIDYERRLARLQSVALGDGPDAGWARRLLTEEFWGAYRPGLEQILNAVLDGAGRRLVEPFTMSDLVLVAGALVHGLMVEAICRPGDIRDGLYAEAVVALSRSLTVPSPQRRTVDEIAAELHAIPASERDGAIGHVAIAQGVSSLFVDGLDVVGFADIADAVTSDVSVEELVEAFGTVRTVAAVSFSRHVGDLRSVASKRFDRSPELALADLVNEIARRAQAEPWVALALVQERGEAAVRSGAAPGPGDIRSLVPIDSIVVELLEAGGWSDADGSASADLEAIAGLLVDTTLGVAAARPTLALSSVGLLVLRLLPGSRPDRSDGSPTT